MPNQFSDPEIVSMRCLAAGPGACYDWHSHPCDEFTFVTDDSAIIGYAGDKHTVPRNTLLFYHRGERHGGWCSAQQSPRFWVLHFSTPRRFLVQFPPLAQREPSRRVWTLPPDQAENFKWLFLQVLNEHTRARDHELLAASSWLRLLLISVHRWASGESSSTIAPEVANPELLKLWHLVNAAVGQPAEFQERIHHYPNYDSLRHAFKKAFGCSPRVLLLRLRIQHAKNLLLESSLSIKEIAIRCGYQRQHEFARAFRQYTHVTPTAWRAHPFAADSIDAK